MLVGWLLAMVWPLSWPFPLSAVDRLTAPGRNLIDSVVRAEAIAH